MNKTKMNILNKVFSRNTLLHLINDKKDSTYQTVVDRLVDEPDKFSNIELIRLLYNYLKNDYRNEYFYKNTMLNKLLLGVHSIRTTTALTEVPISNSKADFLLINGKAVVYEIKTELDNLERLENQIRDYYKAFDHVAVVSYEKNLQCIENIIKKMELPVGVYVLRNRGSLGEIQKPEKESSLLEHDVLFKLLRKYEFEKIILKEYGALPDVSAFRYYSECKRLFSEIEIDVVYPQVLQLLKDRSCVCSEGFQSVPYELKSLVYFMNFKEKEYQKLQNFLESSYGGM